MRCRCFSGHRHSELKLIHGLKGPILCKLQNILPFLFILPFPSAGNQDNLTASFYPVPVPGRMLTLKVKNCRGALPKNENQKEPGTLGVLPKYFYSLVNRLTQTGFDKESSSRTWIQWRKL